MNDIKLKQLVAEAVVLDRAIASQQEQLKRLKARLVDEARARLGEEPGAGGWTVTFQGMNGDTARVQQPGPSLKSKIEADGKPLEKIRAAAGIDFEALFVPVVAYAPVDGFRGEAAARLGPAARRLVKLCETDSPARVSFETKAAAATGG